jgi:hypothetical protein
MSNLVDYSIFQGKIEKYECKCYKLDIFFNKGDSRCWTAVVNPNTDNVFVTHHINKSDLGEATFDVISSDKIITDVDPEDIYQTIELILKDSK